MAHAVGENRYGGVRRKGVYVRPLKRFQGKGSQSHSAREARAGRAHKESEQNSQQVEGRLVHRAFARVKP